MCGNTAGMGATLALACAGDPLLPPIAKVRGSPEVEFDRLLNQSINQSSFKLTALYSPKSSFQVTGTLLRLLAAGSHEAFLTIFRCSTKAFLLTLRYKHELTPGARIGMQCKWVNSIQNPNSLSSFAVNVVFFGNMLKKKEL